MLALFHVLTVFFLTTLANAQTSVESTSPVVRGEDLAKESDLVEKKLGQKPYFKAVVPIPVAFFTPETGFGGGVGVVNAYRADDAPEKLPDSNFLPVVLATQKRQSIIRAIWDHYFWKGDYHILSNIGHSRYPDKFFGVGNKNDLKDEEVFVDSYQNLDFRLEKLISAHTYLGAGFHYDRSQIVERELGGRLDRGDLLGYDSGRAFGLSANLIFNTRDHNFSPKSGSVFEFTVTDFLKELKSDFDYQRRQVRLRHYRQIDGPSSLLALELRAEDAVGQVPFRKLPNLGGQYFLRGYYQGRFRDKKLLGLQVAYRRLFTKDWGMVFFGGNGAVAESWEEWFTNAQHVSFGTGFRYVINRETGINLRIDLAIAKDSTGFYIGVGEAF